MENYSKGKNVEEELELARVPIPNIPEGVAWMHVKPGSKIFNLIDFALKAYKDGRTILWSGAGAAVNKTITCAEITKRNYPEAHQFNKIAYIKCEEHWDPKLDRLDKLVVSREIPAIHILLSKEPINLDLPGYQPPKPLRENRRPPYNSNRGKRRGNFNRNSQRTPATSQKMFPANL